MLQREELDNIFQNYIKINFFKSIKANKFKHSPEYIIISKPTTAKLANIGSSLHPAATLRKTKQEKEKNKRPYNFNNLHRNKNSIQTIQPSNLGFATNAYYRKI